MTLYSKASLNGSNIIPIYGFRCLKRHAPMYICVWVYIYVMIIIKGDTKTLGAGSMGGVGGEEGEVVTGIM